MVAFEHCEDMTNQGRLESNRLNARTGSIQEGTGRTRDKTEDTRYKKD
jgi:hypothetical protein